MFSLLFWRETLTHIRRCFVLVMLLAVLAPGLLWAQATSTHTLPAPVAQAMQRHNIPASAVGIWVQEIGANAPVLVHNPDTPFNPASVSKLPASFAALAELGPNYTWKTEFYTNAPIRNGVLQGDLWIKGHGDPFLVADEVWKMLGALQRRGIRRIEGDLVFDLSYYNLPYENPGAFDNQPYRAYNQTPHALLTNFNTITLEMEPEGTQLRVVTDPPLDGLRIDNRVQLTDSKCESGQNTISYNVVESASGVRHIVLEGRYPRSCGRYRLVRTALTPEAYTNALIRAVWKQWGGEIQGGWRTGTWPNPRSRPLLVHESRTLAEVIRMVNKFSNNVMTRQMALALGAETYGAPATCDKASRAILKVLAEHGIDTQGMIMDNASGLSRNNRISARQLAQLLWIAREHTFMPEFVSSLALVGQDGTVRRRFQNGPKTGRMHLKTGTLNSVSAVAGYVRSDSDKNMLVVVLINHREVQWGSGRELQNAVLAWTFNH